MSERTKGTGEGYVIVIFMQYLDVSNVVPIIASMLEIRVICNLYNLGFFLMTAFLVMELSERDTNCFRFTAPSLLGVIFISFRTMISSFPSLLVT